jgi:hypothetical protein
MDYTFYKFSDFSGAMHILDGTLKFSKPSSFNDPFDCLPGVKSVRLDDQRVVERFQQQNREPTLREKMAFSCQINDPNYHREQADSLRILSLTKSKKNILMWSHYADQHRGGLF